MPPNTRTKQSAIKSTGGRAERKSLPSRRSANARTRDIIMSSPLPITPPQAMRDLPAGHTVREADVRNLSILLLLLFTLAQWCYSCVDGGNLIVCNLCARALCTKCIQLPISYEDLAKSNYWFACPTCHYEQEDKRKRAQYFVRHIFLFRLTTQSSNLGLL